MVPSMCGQHLWAECKSQNMFDGQPWGLLGSCQLVVSKTGCISGFVASFMFRLQKILKTLESS